MTVVLDNGQCLAGLFVLIAALALALRWRLARRDYLRAVADACDDAGRTQRVLLLIAQDHDYPGFERRDFEDDQRWRELLADVDIPERI